MRQGQSLNGRYYLDERIGSGGMGEVWRGHDARLYRPVAIKILHQSLADDTVSTHRLHVEARAVASLRAPGIVSIYDFGRATGENGPDFYLIMELIDGNSLQQVLVARQRLDTDETLRIIAATAEALDAAHRAQVIHRDIKPGNILIDANGVPHIVDFGIARVAGASGLTSTGVVMGTVAYVAPEQLRGEEPTPASDIYSLGVVAYQCLAGRKPFDSEMPAAAITGTLHEEPPPFGPEVPESVAAIVMRALAKHPDDRWASAAEFAAACRAPEDAKIPVPVTPVRSPAPSSGQDEPPPTTPTLGNRPRRDWRFTIAALVAVLLLGALSTGAYFWPREPEQEGTVADSEEWSEVFTFEDEITTSRTSESTGSPSTPPASGSNAPSSSSAPPKSDAAMLPDVIGVDEEDAIYLIQDEGFDPDNINTSYGGDGSYECVVDSQNPPGEKKYDKDIDVTIFVERVDDPIDCPISRH